MAQMAHNRGPGSQPKAELTVFQEDFPSLVKSLEALANACATREYNRVSGKRDDSSEPFPQLPWETIVYQGGIA